MNENFVLGKGETLRVPRNASDAQRALSMKRKTGEKRNVVWYHIKTRARLGADRYVINVAEGNELTIIVHSGIPFLTIESGHVTVVFKSNWGNSLTIAPGASAHVVVPYADTKVTIAGDDAKLTMDLPKGKHRVYWPSKYPPFSVQHANR